MRGLLGASHIAAIGLFATALVVAVLAVAVDLPGPSLKELVGMDENGDPLALEPCTQSADSVRLPDDRGTPETWRSAAPLPFARDELRAASVGTRVFVTGGFVEGRGGRLRSSSEFLILDTRTGSFERGPDLPTGIDHAETISDGRDVWVVGGFSDTRARSELLRYSPETRRWSTEARLRIPRGGAGAGVIGDRIYVAGGSPPTLPDPEQEPYDSLEIYDTQTGRWVFSPDMPTARHHVASAVLDGKLYVLGGRSPDDFSLAAFERYDPDREQWEELPPLPEGTGGPAAVAAGGQIVLVAGGDDRERWVTPATWAFDPDTGRWRRLSDLTTARHGHAAAAIGRRVYAIGGAPCPGYGRTNSVEVLRVR